MPRGLHAGADSPRVLDCLDQSGAAKTMLDLDRLRRLAENRPPLDSEESLKKMLNFGPTFQSGLKVRPVHPLV